MASSASVAWIDAMASLPATERPLYGSKGYVRLVDCLPRLVPEGRGCDYMIATRARVSTGQGMKSPSADAKLVERLYRDGHTSPFEGVSFMYELQVPMFVAQHLLRHRTAKVNVFSQRYAEVPESLAWYTPPPRAPHPTNKQQSVVLPEDDPRREYIEIYQRLIDEHLDAIMGYYHELIKAGCAREVARYCLPNSTMTRLVFEMDLHNLLKFWKLRCTDDAQDETREVACAMKDLVLPLLPIVRTLL